MGSGHAHALYVHEHSPLHDLAARAKILGLLAFVVAVASTPPSAVWAFAVYAGLLGGVIWSARIGFRFVLVRLVAILPFIAFAFLVPFIATGDRVAVGPLELSASGLWAAWGIVVKASLGAAATITLTGTTEVADILRGLTVLRVPAAITAIAMFMIRYLEIISDEIGRMRTAMHARGYEARWIGEARPLATGAGALFIRSYERGERVHAAMLARGFEGGLPVLATDKAVPWLRLGLWCATVAAIAVGVRLL